VLFSMRDKSCIKDPKEHVDALLPENWHQVAYVIS
jgi:hypothetical protein